MPTQCIVCGTQLENVDAYLAQCKFYCENCAPTSNLDKPLKIHLGPVEWIRHQGFDIVDLHPKLKAP